MENYPLRDTSVNDLTIEDLQQLVKDKVKAGYHIDYHPVGNSFAGRKLISTRIASIARTIASFANTDGGWCILGIKADADGIPTINGTDESNLKDYVKALDVFVENEIDLSFKQKITSSRKYLPLQDNKNKEVLVIYIPPQLKGDLLSFKTDNRIYRRFQESFGEPFPDIGGEPFYHYQTFDELKQNNQNAYIEADKENTLSIKDIWRLREFHQDSAFKPEHLEKIKSLIAQDKVDEIIVYNIEGFHVLVDGFYRVAASIEANVDKIKAIVEVDKKKEEGLKESCTANTSKRRSLATRERAIETYFRAIGCSNDMKLPPGYTQEIIAQELNVSQTKITRYIATKKNNINKNNNQVRPRKTEKMVNLKDIAQKFDFSENELNRWIEAIKRKGQAIIYGPPGTGKTFLAKELAKFLTQTKEDETNEDETNEDETKKKGKRWDIVQFHPSYSYEDFIQGIRPEIVKEKSQDELSTDDQSSTEVNGQIKYKWEEGRFLKFCEPAENQKNKTKTYVLIIDEINRANLSSVFGELMYLLEYRGETIKLAGNGKEFEIPKNVLIIGTMNTADRSVSPIDNALRRRFAFLHLPPKVEILDCYYKDNKTQFPIDDLKNALDYINKGITNDNFKMGVSFFLLDKKLLDKELDKNSAKVKDIWEMEIIPYLKDNSFILNDELKKLLLDNDLTWDKIKSISSKANQSDVSNTTN